VGSRRLDLLRHPSPWRVAPVRIAAGAVGPGIPARDLILSPDHAVSIAGVLVMAADLVDGHSIRRIDDLSEITYFHVELPSHDIVLAEDLPVESYLDTGNRHDFAAGTVLSPRPGTPVAGPARAIAPLERNPVVLGRVRARLNGAQGSANAA
jgi:hypothetical protein